MVGVYVKAGLWTGLDSGLDWTLDWTMDCNMDWPGSLAGSLLNINGKVLGAGRLVPDLPQHV